MELSQAWLVIASFLVFLLIFLGIGLLSMRQHKQTSEDYLLAGQGIPAWMAALSAVATNNSGYMFIGLIGFAYTLGLATIWFAVGWISGDFAASLFIHKRLRQMSQQNNALSFSEVISTWQPGKRMRLLQVVGAPLR